MATGDLVLTTKRKMISSDAAEHLYKCGQIWRQYLAGNPVVVVTEHSIKPHDLFGDYFDVIKKGIDKGLVKMLTLSQVEAEHLDMCLIEF